MDLEPDTSAYDPATPTAPGTEYYEASQTAARSSRLRTVTAIAATAIVVGAVAIVATTLGSSNGTRVSNEQLLTLVHSASKAFQRVPSTTFRMTMTISAQGHAESIVMTGVSATRTHAATFDMKGPGVDEGIISVKGVGYLQVPAGSISKNHGKPWLAVRSPKPTAQEQQLTASGPAGLLKALATVGGSVESQGSKSVAGVQTTEYSFHADLLNVFGATYRQMFGPGVIARLRLLGFDHLPMKLWLDNRGLPREMSLGFTFRGVSMQEVAYMTPSNAVPTITAPPASEVRMAKSVRDFATLIRQFTGLPQQA